MLAHPCVLSPIPSLLLGVPNRDMVQVLPNAQNGSIRVWHYLSPPGTLSPNSCLNRLRRLCEQVLDNWEKMMPPYPIEPPAPREEDVGTRKHTDIALTGLFSAHVALVNSERAAIWRRYNVMLLANSLIIGFLVREANSGFEIITAVLFGLVLCVAWWFISTEGWKVFDMYSDAGRRFYWTNLDTKDDSETNPLNIEYEKVWKGGWIKVIALGVIAWFGIMYVVAGAIRQFGDNTPTVP